MIDGALFLLTITQYNLPDQMLIPLGPVYLSWLIFVRDKSVLIAAQSVQLSHSK